MFGTLLGLSLMLQFAAPDPSVEVSWQAPEGCPRAPVVQQAIADNLARDDFTDALADVHVQAEVQGGDGAWTLSVAVTLPGGTVQRELSAPTCDELATAAGLIIAVALDPLRVQEVRPLPEPDPLPKAWSAPEPEPEPEPEPPSQPEPEPEPPQRLAGELRGGGQLGLGALPEPRGGAQLGLGMIGRWFRADLSLLYWAPRAIRPFDAVPSNPGARLQQAGAGLRGCLAPKLGALEPSSCVGLEGGLGWGRGLGVPSPQTTTLPWLTTHAGLELAWVSGVGIGVFAGVDAQFHLVRPSVRLDGLGQALRVAPVGARVAAGVLWRWGG